MGRIRRNQKGLILDRDKVRPGNGLWREIGSRAQVDAVGMAEPAGIRIDLEHGHTLIAQAAGREKVRSADLAHIEGMQEVKFQRVVILDNVRDLSARVVRIRHHHRGDRAVLVLLEDVDHVLGRGVYAGLCRIYEHLVTNLDLVQAAKLVKEIRRNLAINRNDRRRRNRHRTRTPQSLWMRQT